MILIVGPTGSGKSTTMCAMLQELCSEETNIMTLEDPVEYDIPGVSQCQINEKTGMTFAAGLRAILRQDPISSLWVRSATRDRFYRHPLRHHRTSGAVHAAHQ